MHRINYYPVVSAIGFQNTYPVGSDLSGEQRYLACSRRLDSGVRHEGVKERGKKKEGERGVGVNSFALTPYPTPSLFILLTSFCVVHTI